MGRFYCDYCDVFLIHDSPGGRKQHARGRKHCGNVQLYYSQFLPQAIFPMFSPGALPPMNAMGGMHSMVAGGAMPPIGRCGMQFPMGFQTQGGMPPMGAMPPRPMAAGGGMAPMPFPRSSGPPMSFGSVPFGNTPVPPFGIAPLHR